MVFSILGVAYSTDGRIVTALAIEADDGAEAKQRGLTCLLNLLPRPMHRDHQVRVGHGTDGTHERLRGEELRRAVPTLEPGPRRDGER